MLFCSVVSRLGVPKYIRSELPIHYEFIFQRFLLKRPGIIVDEDDESMVCELTESVDAGRLTADETKARLAGCDRLPSLGSVNFALQNLLSREDSSVQQISAHLLRDPSLTSRVLRLTNSPFYGLAKRVNSLDEAVFYLGVSQIKRLVMVSPIIDQFSGSANGQNFSWKEFWKHSIAVATVSQELLNGRVSSDADDSGYLGGLVHDVGKIAIAIAFPEIFSTIQTLARQTLRTLDDLEREFLGMDHAEIGAYYFESQKMPEFLIHSTRFHHRPSEAPDNQAMAAAVYIADYAVHGAGIGMSGNPVIVKPGLWKSLEAWDQLFPNADARDIQKVQRRVDKLIFKLPDLVEEIELSQM